MGRTCCSSRRAIAWRRNTSEPVLPAGDDTRHPGVERRLLTRRRNPAPHPRVQLAGSTKPAGRWRRGASSRSVRPSGAVGSPSHARGVRLARGAGARDARRHESPSCGRSRELFPARAQLQVVHGESGSLVRHGDVTALADAIRSLFRDPRRLHRLTAGARARAEGFTWDAPAAAIEQHLTAVAAGERPALAGAWARYRQTPPLATVGLARTGTGVAPFGAASWVVEAVGGDGAAIVRVSVGASDGSGRRVLATVRVLQRRSSSASNAARGIDERSDQPSVIELPGWPLDHELFLREMLMAVVGSPLTLASVRRVAEPLAPTSPVAERDDRVDRRRTPRRTEAGDHADGRQR